MLGFSKKKDRIPTKEFENIKALIMSNFPVANIVLADERTIVIVPKFPLKVLKETYELLQSENNMDGFLTTILLQVQNPMGDYAENLLLSIRKELQKRFPKYEWERIRVIWDKNYSDKETLYQIGKEQVIFS